MRVLRICGYPVNEHRMYSTGHGADARRIENFSPKMFKEESTWEG